MPARHVPAAPACLAPAHDRCHPAPPPHGEKYGEIVAIELASRDGGRGVKEEHGLGGVRPF